VDSTRPRIQQSRIRDHSSPKPGFLVRARPQAAEAEEFRPATGGGRVACPGLDEGPGALVDRQKTPKESSTYEFIGGAYLHYIMHRELFSSKTPRWQEVVLE